MIYHTYIDDSISAGSSTISGISTRGNEYGVGITSNFQVSGITTLGVTSVSSLYSGITTLGVTSVSSLYSSGIVTAVGGFISVGNTTPIKISLSGNKLIFTASGIGSTSFTLY